MKCLRCSQRENKPQWIQTTAFGPKLPQRHIWPQYIEAGETTGSLKIVFSITPKSIIEVHQTHRITAAPARILNRRVQTAAYDLSMEYSICSRK